MMRTLPTLISNFINFAFQAFDRIYRVGQTKNVFVHKLISEGTVDEQILKVCLFVFIIKCFKLVVGKVIYRH